VTTPATSGELSPQEQLAEALDAREGPNGEIDKQLALDMFAAAYGSAAELGATPLPGAVEPSTALRLVLQAWDQLTPEQQQVVQAKLDLPVAHSETIDFSGEGTSGALAVARLGSKPGPGIQPLFIEPTDPIVSFFNAQASAVASLWGSSLAPIVMKVDIMAEDLPPSDDAHGPPLADTLPVRSDGRTWAPALADYAICRVRVFPAFTRISIVDQKATAAHEIFHCFQSTVISLTDSIRLRFGQLWVIEGQASWVGATIAGGGETASGWWRVWLNESRPLWKRDYDALGFYASLARHGVNPWTVFRPMLSLGPVAFARMYAAATPGLEPAFLAQVAVDHASLTAIGDPWLPVGPGAAPYPMDPPENVRAGGGVDWEFDLRAFDFDRLSAIVPEEVATVTTTVGPWAVGGSGDVVVVDGAGDLSGCVRGDCVCPGGLALAIPRFATNGRVAIGLTNATMRLATVMVTVKSVSLAEACATLPQGSPLGCMVGQWTLSQQAFDDPFVPGLEGINYSGGVRGRHLDIAANGTYVMTDDGTDPVTGHGNVGGVRVDVTVTTVGRVVGAVQRTSENTAIFASSEASIDIHVHENVAGTPIDIDHHYDEASYFGNGEAIVTCSGNSMTTKFPNASFTYTRG
jgi:hypothetical protein